MKNGINSLFDLRKELLKDKIRQHPLEIVIWEATTRCNMNCVHCGTPVCTGDELSTEEVVLAFKHIARQFDSRTIRYVAITGGEPTIRDDVPFIVENIARLGFSHIVLQTNGIRIASEDGYLEELIEAGIKGIGVNLDGLRDSNNWLRASKDSFDISREAFNKIKDYKINNLINTVVTEHTMNELPDLGKLIEILSPQRWRLIPLEPIGRAKEKMMNQVLSPRSMKMLIEYIINKRSEEFPLELGCGEWYGKELEGLVRPYIWHCIAGITVMSILADGSIGACNNIDRRFNQGNIRKDNVKNIWNNKFEPFRFFDRKRNNSWCKKCLDWDLCHGGDMHLRNDKNEMIKRCFYSYLGKEGFINCLD